MFGYTSAMGWDASRSRAADGKDCSPQAQARFPEDMQLINHLVSAQTS